MGAGVFVSNCCVVCLVVSGSNILDEHCVIENKDGFVVLDPFPEASCSVNGTDIRKRVRLQQGMLI